MTTKVCFTVAGLGWLESTTGFHHVMHWVDGQGGIDQAMNAVDTKPAAGYGCLGFTAGQWEVYAQ